MFKVIHENHTSKICLKFLSCSSFNPYTCSRRFLQQTHYDVLELPRNCSSKQIRDAFIRLSKQSHPDVNKNDPRSQERFVRVSEAYNVLIKPCSRRDYDNTLKQYVRPQYHTYSTPRYTDQAYKVWSDPSFYENRDRSKDSYYRQKPYYGIRGIKRVSNLMIVFILVGFTTFGVGIQLLAIINSHTMSREEMMRRSQEYNDYHAMVKERAARYGSIDRQVEEFQRRRQ